MIVKDNVKVNTMIMVNKECEKILMPALSLYYHTGDGIEIKIHKNLSIKADNVEARREVLEKLINDVMNEETLYKFVNYLKRTVHNLLIDNNFTYIQDIFGYSYLVDQKCENALVNVQIKPVCEFFFRPTFFTIDITYHCNLKCLYCARRLIHDRQQVIDPSTLKSILDFIVELSAMLNLSRIYVQPYGGEPTLYNNLIFFY
ncbi:radical SAM protein [Vulcanisaeta sp. JCM 14467]|uniref:radical SAM protein n=1 Tax=Vulcanisaeta sp. JCM 14467 TaxID=1295370 RepID=UPI0006D2558B|nr:radical SAM protein [Vulcanisaeta sp. JCM 14467]